MRSITKGNEPSSLTAHRQILHCDYANYGDKVSLRYALVAEQRGLCCYCMGRIHNDPATMKIEHWRCQSKYPNEQLNYKNMLGSCLGGDGQPPDLQHCDTLKGDQDLRWNPSEKTHNIEARIQYESDGSIRSEDDIFDTQLNDVLNLNLPIFKNQRKGVLDAVLYWWHTERKRIGGAVPRNKFEREHAKRLKGTAGLQPYCQVAVWWLEVRLARMSS